MTIHFRILSLSILSITLLFPCLVFAGTTQGTLSTDNWNDDEEVTISGTNLEGIYFHSKKLCLVPEGGGNEVCFGHYDADKKQWINDSEFIKIWNENTIIFTPPSNAPYRGTVKLYTTDDARQCVDNNPAYCSTVPTQSQTIIGQYLTHPIITGMVELDSAQPAATIKTGKRYEIRGGLFGAGGDIFFGERAPSILQNPVIRWKGISRTDIVSWTHNSIIFSPSETVDFSNGVKVNNTASDSNVYVLSSISQSSSSQFSSHSSVAPETASSFTDISSSHPYYPAIVWAKNAGVLSGYPDGTFKPDNIVNRAELLKIVLGVNSINVSDAGGTSGFKDVNESSWYAPYVRYAKTQGIIQGYPDGTFKPNQPVNFVEALKMAYNALDVTTNEIGGNWYDRFLQHAKLNDVLFASDGAVGAGMSRKDVVWIVWKLMTHSGAWQQAQGTTMSVGSSSEMDTANSSKKLNIQFVTIFAYWTNWDSDAENDGFKLEPHFKDVNDKSVYPDSKDWKVTVKVYNAESDYNKYSDFKTHRLDLQDIVSFSGNDVKYEEIIGYPFVRVPIDKLPHFSSGTGYSWIEAEFSSPTYGAFSASEEKPPSFRKG